MRQSRKTAVLAGSLLLVCGMGLASARIATLGSGQSQAVRNASPHLQSATPLAGGFDARSALSADIMAAETGALSAHASGIEAVSGQNISFTPLQGHAAMRAATLTPCGTAASSSERLTSTVRMPRKRLGVKRVEGYYIAKDFVHAVSEVNCVMQVVADANDSTMIHIHNFYGLEETVDAVIDFNTGALSILPQRIWQSSSYGDVYMFPISYVGDRVQFYPTQPVPGSIDADGVIRLGQWGAIVGQGANAGLMLAAIDASEYYPANATMTAVKITDGQESSIQYPLLVEQANPAEMKIYNFGTTAVPVKARVAPGGGVTVSPQFIANVGMYGAFNCFPITMTPQGNSIDKTAPVTGRMADGKVNFDSWVAGSIMQDGLVALWLKESTLTPAAGLTLAMPQSVPLNLEGAGTAASPWLIKTASEMVALSQAAVSNSFPGKHFRLAADIDMSQAQGFVPIGTNKSAFNGTFDGAGHIISGLSIDAVGYHFQGLFGACYTNSTLKNIIIRRSSLTGDGYYLGLVAGYSQGVIDNCRVQGDVSGAGLCVGGVVGRSYGTVQRSSFSGSVDAAGYVGGIAGYSYGAIDACHSDADVSIKVRITDAASCVGGIAGLAQSFSTDREGIISDCRFSGTVTQASGYGFTGGIAGYMYAVEVKRCLNTGSVAATSASATTEQTGGIAGIVRDVIISDCLNAGAVSSQGTSAGTGGLIGFITTSYSTIGGMLEPISVKNSYNSGQVLARQRTAHAGVFGDEFVMEQYPEKPSDTAFNNVYTDNQATGLDDDRFGHNTDFFTAALPQGFQQQTWQSATGLYPTLKVFASTDEGLLSQAVPVFAAGESSRVMKHTASLAAPAGVRWYVLSEGEPTDISAALLIDGNSLSLRGIYANDTIMAAIPGQRSGRRMMINVVPKVFDGEGTAQSPFLIKDKADFMRLHDAVMHYDHRGDFFRQTADVDFGQSSDFSGVGAGNHLKAFAGTFDGAGHRIKGLKIDSYRVSASGTLLEGTYNYGGLFHIGAPESVIKNVVIDSDCRLNFYNQSGAIIGYTEGRVEDCRNYAAVSGVQQTGGIVGYIEQGGAVSGCYNAGTVRGSKDYTGGIAGQNMGTLANSQNDADITGTKYVGGVAGASAGSVSFGVNSAIITGDEYTGGVIGSNSAGYSMGDVTDCLSSGFVICPESTCGGVVGYSNGRGTVERNFYDASINNMDGCSSLSQGFTPLATSQLVSKQAPEGINTERYYFSASAYPSLKEFATEDCGIAARGIFVLFDKGEKRTNVIKTTGLATDARITWTLKVKENFSLADGKLLIDLPENDVVADTLTAVFGSRYTKVFPLKSIPVILAGQGSESAPFQIRTHDDIALLASFIERSGMDYEGYVFRVENDIEYPDTATFKPISLTGTQFQGTLDGAGHKISGFKYTDETSKTGKNIGFFGTLGSKALVKNLTLDGDIKAYSYAGTFAGLLYGRIENCVSLSRIDVKNGYGAGFAARMYDGARIDRSVFSGIVGGSYTSNMNYQGGFAGQLDNGAVIDGCVNKGTVGNVKNTTGTQWTGGIAGDAAGLITASRNEGTVQGRMNIAGIAGRLAKTGRILDCVNTADIDGVGSNAAGIFAKDQGSGTAEVRRCSNSGNIKGKSYVAGIAGQIQSGVTLDSCFNTGKITGFGATAYGVGGVIGQMASAAKYPSSATNSWNSGEVYNESQSTGGFAGKINSGVVSYCYNTGNVTVNKEKDDLTSSGVGGFAGSFCAEAHHIWNSGNVVSNVPSAAGIFGTGAMPIAKVSHAANFGDVTLSRVVPEKGFGAAGIWGGYGPADISDCYNYGTITAPDWVAGIDAAMHSNGNGGTSIRRCFNAGKVVATLDTAAFAAAVAQVSHYVDTRNPIDPTLMKTDSVYFDKETCTALLATDTIGSGLSRLELMQAPLGDAFAYPTACFPMLAFLDSVPVAAFHSAYILFADGDSADNVNATFRVGAIPGAVWTSSPNIRIDADGIATVDATGDGWVKVTPDDPESTLEKSVTLVLKTSGIDSALADGRTVVRRDWFTLGGVRISEPSAPGLYIAVTRYEDGTVESRRVMIAR